MEMSHYRRCLEAALGGQAPSEISKNRMLAPDYSKLMKGQCRPDQLLRSRVHETLDQLSLLWQHISLLELSSLPQLLHFTQGVSLRNFAFAVF